MKKSELAEIFLNCDIERDIEQIREEDECTYMEAIVTYCEKMDVQPEDITPVLPETVKEKFKAECIDRKLVKGRKSNSLTEYLL